MFSAFKDSMMGHDETSNGSYEITNTVDPTKETSETNEVETSDEVDPEAQKEMKKEISDSDTKRREFSHAVTKSFEKSQLWEN